MAQASPAKRRLRRVKRERTLAYRMCDQALKERNLARAFANHLAARVEELEKSKEPVVPEEVTAGSEFEFEKDIVEAKSE